MPITSDMAKALVTKYSEKYSKISDLRFFLTCLLGLAGFLRIEELLNIKLKHINIQESHLEILIPKLKKEHHREGHVVYISE